MPDRIYCLPEKLLPSTVGPVLRDYRIMSQFGRAQMAGLLDIKPDTLTRWEKQHTALRSDQMVKFANAIDLEVVLFDRFEFRQLYGDHLERQENRLSALTHSVNRRG